MALAAQPWRRRPRARRATRGRRAPCGTSRRRGGCRNRRCDASAAGGAAPADCGRTGQRGVTQPQAGPLRGGCSPTRPRRVHKAASQPSSGPSAKPCGAGCDAAARHHGGNPSEAARWTRLSRCWSGAGPRGATTPPGFGAKPPLPALLGGPAPSVSGPRGAVANRPHREHRALHQLRRPPADVLGAC